MIGYDSKTTTKTTTKRRRRPQLVVRHLLLFFCYCWNTSFTILTAGYQPQLLQVKRDCGSRQQSLYWRESLHGPSLSSALLEQRPVSQLNARAVGGSGDEKPPFRAKSPKRSSNAPLTPQEAREVDLGIFGSRNAAQQPSPTPTQQQQRADIMRVNGDTRSGRFEPINGDYEAKGSRSRPQQQQQRGDGNENDNGGGGGGDNDDDDDDDKFRFFRSIARRIRGKDESPPSLSVPPTQPAARGRSKSNPTPFAQQGLFLLAKSVRDKNNQASSTSSNQGNKKKVPVQKKSPPKAKIPSSFSKKKAAKLPTTSLADVKAEEEQESSWTDRLTSWIGDFRKGQDDNSEDPKKDNDGSSPFSKMQKFWTSALEKSKKKGDKTNQEEWVTVFPTTRISPGELVPVTVAGIDLLVIASNDGKNRLYCIANSCPHLGTPLELGQLVRLPIEEESASSSSKKSLASKTSGNDKDKNKTIKNNSSTSLSWTERQVSSILQQDGCEDCIVCPLHRTAFALESGQVRGEWCPYPPLVGALVGAVKPPAPAATFGVRVRGKDVQVRINTPIQDDDDDDDGGGGGGGDNNN
ncbi:hypothetical protein ACA910_002582 [Epithemia clementina (nom. ined.)]